MKERAAASPFLAVVFTAFLSMLGTPEAFSETIQLERLHGIYMVPVRINNAIIVPFVLDSGAAEVAIPADVFLTLRRTGTVNSSDFIGTGTYVLADGSVQSSDRFVLREVSVANHVIKDVVANVVSVKGDPLLGQSFLSKLPAWSIDNARHTLVLNDAAGSTGEQNLPYLFERLRNPVYNKTFADLFRG